MSTSTIKARIQLDDHGVATVRTLIAHPMLIDRTDPKTGARLPAHFIEEVEITLNGIPAISLEWGRPSRPTHWWPSNYTASSAATYWESAGKITRARLTPANFRSYERPLFRE